MTQKKFLKKRNYLSKYKNIFRKKKLCIKIHCVSVFLDIAKFPDFQWKNADAGRTQAVCHLINIYFGSSFGKV